MSINFIARKGRRIVMSLIIWGILTNIVSFSLNRAAAQCLTQECSLDSVEFDYTVEGDPATDGKEGIVSLFLNGDIPGEDFTGFDGLDLILEFNESLASLLISQFEFDSCWINKPGDFSQTTEVIGTHKLRIHLNNTNCTPAKGTGLLAKVRLVHEGTGFDWASAKLADGGILIEDIFPAKMHSGRMEESTPNLKIFTLPNRQFKLRLNRDRIQSVKILNIRGEVLNSFSQGDQEDIRLDLEGFNPGIYILVVKSESGNLLKHKIVLY